MNDVRFSHHGRDPCLEGIDLSVDAGQAVLVEAPSGGGKSTLLRIACGLVPRTAGGRIGGEARLEGCPVHEIAPARLPARIGYVPQDPETAFVARTVGRELKGILGNLGVTGRECRLRIEQVLHEVGAGGLAEREVSTLSGGEAARAAIAAALVGEPDVLVLDEPTGQLDHEGAVSLAATLNALRAGGLAILLAAHRPHPFDDLVTERVELATYPDPPPVPRLPTPAGGDPLVELTSATCTYDDGLTVGPLDLAVEPGEVVVLTGPNGSGKTTALHLACGLHAPSQGEARLLGDDPHELDAGELAARVGVSFQHPAWHITQDTVHEEITLTGRTLERTIPADRTLARLGLDTLARAHPWDLSGGERQRLAVGTAMAHDPPALLLDEPTRGLDGEGLQRFGELLARRSAQGKATVVASHHPWLGAIAHRIVSMGPDTLEPIPRVLPGVPA